MPAAHRTGRRSVRSDLPSSHCSVTGGDTGAVRLLPMSSRVFNREILVAASLVGSVVIVIGYASGFGVRPVFGAEAQRPGGGPVVTNQPPVTTQAPVPTTTAAPPAAGNPVPRAVIPVAGNTPAAPPVATQPAHPVEPTDPPATSTTPAVPGTPQPPPCQPRLLPAALDTLLQTLG